MGQAALLYNGGDAPAPYELNLKFPDASSKVAEILMAMRSSEGLDGNKRIVDLVNETSWARCPSDERGWDSTLGTATGLGNDLANGAIGDVAAVDSSAGDVTSMLRRVRLTRTTKLDSLRGWERVILRARAASGSKWEVQLRWAPSLANPATETNEVVIVDDPSATQDAYVEKELGNIRIPKDGTLGGVGLEIWARLIAGGGLLYLNLARLLPATPGKDVLTRLAVKAAEEIVLGKDLSTPVTQPGGGSAGTVNGADLLLDPLENAGIAPNDGLGLPAGYHEWHYDLTAEGTSGSVTFRLRDITSNNDEAIQTVFPVGGRQTHVLAATITDANLYQAQIVNNLSNPAIIARVHSVRHRFFPAFLQNEQALTDPLRGAEKLDASGGSLGRLAPKGPVPFWIPPGLAAVFAVPLDVPRASYSDPESVKARTMVLSGAGAPRHFT